MGREMACQPVQASSSCLGSRLSAMILVRSSMILAACGAAGAILAFAVGAFHAGGDAGQFLALLGIGGSGDGEGELEQLELAGGDGVEGEAVEAGGLLGVVDVGVDGALVELGGDGFGVVGDVGGLDPVGAGLIDAQDEQFLLGIVDEFAGVLGGGLGGGAGGEERRGEQAGEGSRESACTTR